MLIFQGAWKLNINELHHWSATSSLLFGGWSVETHIIMILSQWRNNIIPPFLTNYIIIYNLWIMIIDTFELEERKDQSELREWNWPWENQIFNILKYNPRNLLFIQRIYKDQEIEKTDGRPRLSMGLMRLSESDRAVWIGPSHSRRKNFIRALKSVDN